MEHLFLKACYNEPIPRTPVWLMRQAGRYMAEYQAIRKKYDFLTCCRTPELACQITLQPIDKLGVDAAILFSDILISFPQMGLDLEFNPAPKVANPVRNSSDIDALKIPDTQSQLGFILDGIKQIRSALDNRVPLIGFAGAPFTLAAYMIEGGGSKNFVHLKSLLYDRPKDAKKLLNFLVRSQAEYLGAQIDAGAQAIQIFDTWAGILSKRSYKEFILEPVQQLIAQIKRPGVPIIYFAKDAEHLLEYLPQTGADVLSIGDRLPLSTVSAIVGEGPALQGNFDSVLLFCNQDKIEAEVERILKDAPTDRGFIFNLGHGILPGTPVENVQYMVKLVQERSRKGAPIKHH